MSLPVDALAWVHRGWDHLRLQRPIAAWASWNRALRIEPDQPAASEALRILAAADDLPAAARAVYRYRPPVGDDRRARWDAHFRGRDLSDLEPAAVAFAELADADPEDSAAFYNQALTLAWLGRNVEAIGALELMVEIDASRDFEAAVDAWLLAEVLRHGAGAEELADDFNFASILTFEPDDPDAETFLEPYAGLLRLVPIPAESGVKVFEVLDRSSRSPEELRSESGPLRVISTVVAFPRMLRFSTPNPGAARQFLEEFTWGWDREDSPPGPASWDHCLGHRAWGEPGPLHFSEEKTPLPFRLLDAAALTFRLPEGLDVAERRRLCRERIEWFHEIEWVQTKRRGLSRAAEGLSPINASRSIAAGNLVLGAKLAAIVRFREQLAARPGVASLYGGYPFDRLRRRLGLAMVDPSTVDPADLSCMSLAEAMRLDLNSLDDDQFDVLLDIAFLADDDAPLTEYDRFQEAVVTCEPFRRRMQPPEQHAPSSDAWKMIESNKPPDEAEP